MIRCSKPTQEMNQIRLGAVKDRGIEVHRENAKSLLSQPIRVRCPYCKFDHFGLIADGELSEAA